MNSRAGQEDGAVVATYRYQLLPQRRFAFVSDGITALSGYTPQEHYDDPDLGLKLVHGDDAIVLSQLLTAPRDPDGPVLLRWITRDGRLIWTEHRVRLVRDQPGQVIAIEGEVRDVTGLRAQAGHHAALEQAIAGSQEGIVVTDAAGTITYVNPAFAERSGYRAEELVGHNARILKSGVQPAAFYERMWRRLASGRSFSGGFVNRRKDGTLFREATIISPYRDDDGRIAGYVAIKRETTSERQAIETLARERDERAAIHAALAGLEVGGDAIATAGRICEQLLTMSDIQMATVIAFDEDAATPLVLRTTDGRQWDLPRRMPAAEATALRQGSMGGPWARALEDQESASLTAAARARGITVFGGVGLRTNGTVPGALVVGANGTDPGIADRMLQALREFGPIASALLVEDLKRRLAMRTERRRIRGVIRNGQFEPVFQPVVDLARRTVLGYELLTRFQDGRAPDQQFAAAYAVGLERDLEVAALRRGLAAARGLPGDCWLSANVSPELLTQPAVLRRVLADAGRPLILEITEHRQISDYARIRQAMDRLAPQAVLAVDDAGAGYASLQHILELRPAYVKIDAGIIRGIDADPARQALVAGFRYFADQAGCEPIAEGVETEEEREALRRLGIVLGQGYLFGRPACVESPG